MPPHTDTTDHPSHGWTIEHVETEPITPAQHTSAVAALSALITQWNDNRHSR